MLFDAIEDATYDSIHDTTGPQSLPVALERVIKAERGHGLADLVSRMRGRIVLTAHPTQFYPDEVLSIVADLAQAVKVGTLEDVYEIILQMGKTRFRNRRKPSPEQEAQSLVWFLENVFYFTLPAVQARLEETILEATGDRDAAIWQSVSSVELGFWPGGDRDGNPYVTAETTLRVAKSLRRSILRLYQRDLATLARRLTFPGVIEIVNELQSRLSETIAPFHAGWGPLFADSSAGEDDGPEDHAMRPFDSWQELIDRVREIETRLWNEHNGFFAELVADFRRKVQAFGFHFATIDLRQDSRIHHGPVAQIVRAHASVDDYSSLSPRQRLETLVCCMPINMN